MASYPLTPTALSTIVETDPGDLEVASKLGEALRQTRTIVKNLLTVIMNDDGTLKSVALLSANSVTSSAINAAAVITAKLADLAVSSAKLADLAVTSGKITDLAVITAKLNDLAVITGKLADLAVTTGKVADKAITSAKLANDNATDANRAVQPDHVRDSAIIERTIANLAVSAAKLKSAGNKFMYIDNGSAVQLLEVDQTGDMVADIASGKLKFSYPVGKGGLLSAAAFMVERGGANANAGTATGNAFNVRPSGAGAGSTDFVEIYDPVGLIDFVVVNDSGNKKRIKFNQAGSYYIEAAATAYRCNDHFIRLVDKTASPEVVLFESIPFSTDSTVTVMNTTVGSGVITIPADNHLVQLEHWVQTTRATDGLGRSAQLSGSYPATNSTYVTLFIIKLDV